MGGFDLFVTGRSHFLLSECSLSFNNVIITLTSTRSSARIVELASMSHLANEFDVRGGCKILKIHLRLALKM